MISIYNDNFPSKLKSLFSSSSQKGAKNTANFIRLPTKITQNTIYYSVIGLGIIDFAFTTLNTFNAALQLQCYWGEASYCSPTFDWQNGWPYLPFAAFTLLSGIGFMSFVIRRVDNNALKLVEAIPTLKCSDIAQAICNKKFFLVMLPVTTLHCLSSSTVMFYSTSKMLMTLFRIQSSGIFYYSAVSTAIASSIITSLFSRVADTNDLVSGKKKFREKFKTWFLTCDKHHRLVKIVSLFVFPDMIYNALTTYPGSIQLLDKTALQNSIIKISIASANVASSALLYFAFNTLTALENAEKLEAPEEILTTEDHSLLENTPSSNQNIVTYQAINEPEPNTNITSSHARSWCSFFSCCRNEEEDIETKNKSHLPSTINTRLEEDHRKHGCNIL